MILKTSGFLILFLLIQFYFPLSMQIRYLARWVKVKLCLLKYVVTLFSSLHTSKFAGTFGRVLECWDREAREYVAVKVVRSISKYRSAAMIEIDVLNLLAKHDKDGSRCVQIRRWFDYRNHVCIVRYPIGLRYGFVHWSVVTSLALFQDLISSHVDYSRASLNDLLYGLLKFEPSERLTAREALNHPFFENPT
ncbi:hypothetical protein B296_00008708 [Ensete ventricosum]|uniref:Protein kinase domain-containing protein n=1 Tax=Ensete ventricosum TaxID=4639 RepID=A0A426ZWN8_ENSVE|nr:hypothetical protein B296_00008708 [Ensete ventricosum]